MDQTRRNTAPVFYMDQGETYPMNGMRHRLLGVFREHDRGCRAFRVLACLPLVRFDPGSEMLVSMHAEITCLGCLAA